MSNHSLKIGAAAGVVYHKLENGEHNLTQLKKHLLDSGFDAQTFVMSIGWLAREDKINILKKGNKWSIGLKSTDR
ncbi:MAG: winged helix-turn-helix domain-containing protein [Euryarchaeota archaeon]|nr:winged helix-turn-helix domain-containing protein [Euryarchaeota archaeon]